MKVLRNRARQARLDYQQRIGRDVTITEVAQAIGISRAGLSWIEQNKTQPAPETLVSLCGFYGLTPGDLLEIVDIDDVDMETRYAVSGLLAAA